ncbi:MAG: ExeM/NucH family extracellular endonuclease [Pseudomonadota bacterium]
MKKLLVASSLSLLFSTAVSANVFISEYIEGSSLNKAIELYNSGSQSVDLGEYQLLVYSNGATEPTVTIPLMGSLSVNATYVVADDGANGDILAETDQITAFSLWNGDDAVVLVRNGEVVDAIGQIGKDPGGQWIVSGVGTQNSTLIRNAAVNIGDIVATDAFDPSAEYTALAQDDISDLGRHTFDGADDPIDPDPIDPPDPVDPPSPSVRPLVLTFVIDGPRSGGTPKAIELYATQDIPDLSVCGVGSANNGGGSDGQEFTFPADSAAQGDFIYIANESTEFANFFGFAPDYTNNALAINGDDAIEVFCNGQRVDVYGDINVDGTGEAWEYMDSYAQRVANTLPTGEFELSAWTILPPNSSDGMSTAGDSSISVGTYSAAIGALFFSEYIEGSSNNKAIEIVNTTGGAADLTGYTVEVYSNGNASPNATLELTQTVAASDVFVVANTNASTAVTDVADVLWGGLSFNGDDAVALRDNDGVMLDVFGQIGIDPGSQWGSGDFGTQNNTLRRQSSITIGDTNPDDPFEPAAEWQGFGQDAFDDLGSYDFGGNGGGGGNTVDLGQCFDEATLISAVQGTANSTPLSGQTVVVEAAVTSVNAALGGFFIQEESSDEDGDPATSEALFVEWDVAQSPSLMTGDVIRVLGTAGESFGKTRVEGQELSALCATDSITPLEFSLPFAADFDLETIENMLVTNAQDLVVSDLFSYARFGEVVLSTELIFTPTQLFAPGSTEAQEYEQASDRNVIILDDLSNGAYAGIPTTFGGELSTLNPVRLGTNVLANNRFVVDFGFNNYRLRSIGGLAFDMPIRPEAPVLEGNLKVASFNVLNLFNGDGNGGGFPTSRGADNLFEYERQLEKIMSAIVAIDADVIGLVEIENDGYGPNSAIAQLTDAVNLAYGGDVYAFIDAVSIRGTDQISVGMLYKVDTVSPTGELKVLTADNSSVDALGEPLFDTNRNRPSFAQAFEHTVSSQEIVINVNHLKSKGSGCGPGDDSTNGQGNCNLTRTRAAQALNTWLAQEFPEQPILIIGDLNAYAQEDPIVEFAAGGYANIIEEQIGAEAFSFIFRGAVGTLDYVLANESASALITGIAEWNINASEPIVFDYNEELPSSSLDKPAQYVDDSPFRSSDHDPVIVALQLDLAGDLNGDGRVSLRDLIVLSRAIGSREGQRRYNPDADLNDNGRVNRADLRLWFRLYIDFLNRNN